MSPSESFTLPGRSFLLHLTTQRAFILFGLDFALGLISICANFGLPWIPALLVLMYGLVLLYSAVSLKVSHSEATNNSPYFLGFVFFLVSLFRAFYSVSFTNGDQIDLVIHQLGAALLTTIVGLPLRQALFAFSPSQADQDLFYRTLEEELRRSAAEFRRSQVEMLQIIEDFVAARQSLFKDEQKAIRQYVTSLTKATAVLDGSINDFPNAIATILESSLSKFRILEEQLQRVAVATSGLDTSAIRSSLDSLQNIGSAIKELATSVTALQSSIQTARHSADAMPANFQLQVSSLSEQLSVIPKAAHEQIQVLKEDIHNIDVLLDNFVAILQTKIEAVR